MPLSVVVLLSGRGSNLRALLEAIDRGECAARVSAVVSDRQSCGGLDLASANNIATRTVRPKDYPDRDSWDAALAQTIAELEPELVVLAGFMRIVGPAVLARMPGRIVNVHPSLLPVFPGMDAPAQAVAGGVRISGCTVHVVDAGVDTGAILAQAAVPVIAGDDGPALHARIQAAEHRLLPAVVNAIGKGALILEPQPRWQREPDPTATLFVPGL